MLPYLGAFLIQIECECLHKDIGESRPAIAEARLPFMAQGRSDCLEQDIREAKP